ncbi:lipocalin family protein [uncultured Sanguibacteroides sp.]|uniref:lipocalin family protein n=1 Tax=uncultured Sanguibacteroides sp. TaxID=1635151 RepID=UPI0025DED059|nr:lipocalin family protein [uncultured Sanguibacteroides sp.]
MKSLLFLMLLAGISITEVIGQTEGKVDNTAVDSLDIDKYAGLWYEIARFDHPFERGMVGVTTEYIIKSNGDIEVIGCGYRDSLNGEKREIVGKVHIPDKDKPGILKVTFFLIFSTNYYILEVEKDYSAALIGSSEIDHLWIVSRSPKLPKKKLNDLLKRAQKRGYDTQALIFVPHKSKDVERELADL